MFSQLLFVCVGALVATVVQASILQNEPRDGVIALDMQFDTVSTDLIKRQVGEHGYTFSIGSLPKITLPIGSNKDEVSLFVDTGSWLTQVPDVASKCDRCLLPNGKVGLYDVKKSTTAKKTGRILKSSFGTNAYFNGEGVIDDIWYGLNFKIPGTLFNDVKEIGSVWSNGILGLAKPPKGDENQNIVWNAYKAGLISKPILAINQKNQSASSLQLFLGGYSKSQMTEDYTWTSIKDNNFVGHVDFVNINGNKVKINQTVTLDTGNYGISVSKEVQEALLDALPSDPFNYWGMVSYDLIKDRTMTVSIYGKSYTIPVLAFTGPDCVPGAQHCSYMIYISKDWNWGSSFSRFLNLALRYDEGSYIGIAGWKPSNTNDIVAF
ncbi:SAP98 [Candida jiufengensis]|uniref:SAP98 n=1 Tax=Candida jiufengensis TaxID=497108 RepID=UPI002223FDAB|nr:SAP98 [Candida jiufengensis]KAI5950183.1 SAP98 [Candida jiufengensis]